MGVSEEPIESRLVLKLEALRSVPPMRPEAAERCRSAFLQQVDALSIDESAGQAVSGEAFQRQIGWKKYFTILFDLKERSPMFTSLALILVAVSLLFGGAGATVYAAQDSIPGEALYPLKSLSEQARLGLAADAAHRFTWQMRYIERRVSEASRLAEMGEIPPASLQNQLALQLEQALQLAAGMEDPQAVQALSRLREMLMNQERIVAAVGGGGNPEVQGALLRVRQQIHERLQLCETGLQDPNMLRERLRLRQFAPGQGTGTPAANPSHTPGLIATEAPGAGPGYGPGPHATGTPGTGDCISGTCTPHEYEHEYEEPGPHGSPTHQTPGGSSYGPGPASTQAPGGCTDCGQEHPAQTEASHDRQHQDDGGGQNSGGDHDGGSGGGSGGNPGGDSGGHSGGGSGGGGGKP